MALAAYAVVTAAALLLGCAAFVFVVRRARGGQLAVAAAVFVLLFFNFTSIEDASPSGAVGIWLVATVVGVPAAYALARIASVRFYALTVVSLLTSFPIIQYAIHVVTASDALPARNAAVTGELANVAEKPNIWFFMLDGYARIDQLRLLGYDNSAFTSALRARGFAVNENSYTSYSHTVGAVPAMLDMDYPATGRVDAGERALTPLVRGDNRVVRTLKAGGYRYVHSEPGTWEQNRCGQAADLCIRALRGAGIPIGEVEQALIDSTPLRKAVRKLGIRAALDTGYTTPPHVVREVEAARPALRPPYFVFTHQLSPHPPFRFRADCSRYPAALGDLTVWDPELKDEYIAEVKCLNRRMTEAVDRITSSDPTAIVVMLSDHGTSFGVDLVKDAADWTLAELDERFSVFSAVRLPPRCPQDEQGPNYVVNTFRRVLACIERREPRLAEFRSFVVHKRGQALEMDEFRRPDWPREVTQPD